MSKTMSKTAGLGAKECLSFESRPGTPPEIAKYRRSNNLELGKRFQHPGVADDYKNMGLADKIYGQTDKHSIGKSTAASLINLPKASELQRMNNVKAEKVYKTVNREPLGHGPDRSVALPDKFTKGREPFGEKSVSSKEPAKGIIFPDMREDSEEGNELYKRSHGSYQPGEQRSRKYDWNVNVETTRFGRAGDTIALNGVSTNIDNVLKPPPNPNEVAVNMKRVEDFRNMGDSLGRSKNLGQDSGARPDDIVYGFKPKASGVTAAEVMKGRYRVEDNAQDMDLGKSITPGFRNIALETRAYGCPSIRSDIPAVAVERRSLADSQNYGDDVPAQDLINPPAFSDLAIGPKSLSDEKTKEQLVALFARVGYTLEPRVADHIFDQASQGSGFASVNSFRNALNEFILDNELV